MKLELRPARSEDYAFAQRLYFETMRWIIDALFGWDEASQQAKFARQFEVIESMIIVADGQDVGWLQVQEMPDSVNLGQLYVVPAFQRRGIGTHVLTALMADARNRGRSVTLSVVKINPARRLYERLGFRQTQEEHYKVHMRWDGTRAGQ
ncbi:GNAT family N-acetyltransferase [Rhodospirillaceae bacterium SYSU D60014]|uniref:GNAT family N-acetyltransferase n=1 Tax=Virgifigura deserti TaxID=2268457 RepID=UPI000E6683EA